MNKKLSWFDKYVLGKNEYLYQTEIKAKKAEEKEAYWRSLPMEERQKIVERQRREKELLKNAKKQKDKEIRRKKKDAELKKIKKDANRNKSEGGSGSGFFINNSGYAITNYHVVGSSKKVKVKALKNSFNGKVIAIDAVNDLALLKISTKNKYFFNITNTDTERLDNIITAGFPYGESFSDHVKSTTGIVSALVGPGNNSSQFQISAAIQPGNSGGPVIDANNGSVVGIAVSKLDTEKFIEMYKSIPENINFAIKSSVLKGFLKSNKANYETSDRKKLTNKEINELIEKSVLFISL